MDIKKKIIKASYDLFLKYGLRRVSIDDICSEIRISKKTFYTQFKQKEELVLTILEIMKEEKRKKKVAFSENGNAIDCLMYEYRQFQLNKNNKHEEFVFDLNKYYPEIYRKHLEVIQDEVLSEIADFIHKGIDEGVFREDLHVQAMAMLLHAKFTELFLDFRSKLSLSHTDAYNILHDATIHLLASEKGLEYYRKLRTNDSL